ncbi:hypothetical protein C8J57DRAFT_1505696 [Mycena rebaudengoi]|nr:hypothetical protein C8J57DRAFT_1505696 [Mycena rebaudengoi]
MGSKVRLCDACSRMLSSDLLPSPKEMADLVEILRSNYEPPEPSPLRAVISDAPAELARYDFEIIRLQGILDEMRTARDSIQSRYNTCRSIASALRRLPSEILCDIFALIPPDAQQVYGIKTEMTSIAQVHLLRLAGVCLRWRGLVMGSPVLWSEILLKPKYWAHGDGPAQARMLGLLKFALDRGANSPMTLHVEHDSRSRSPEPLTLLAQHSGRWRRVTLSLRDHNIQHLSAVKGQLPLLEALTIDGNSLGARGPDLFDLFGDAPRLTSLTCTLNDAVQALSTFSGMKQLQHFSLRVKPEQLGAALSFANKLSPSTRFVLRVHHARSLSPVVAHIQALVLHFTDDDMDRTSEALGEIFDNLTLNAQELSIISIFFVAWPLLESLVFSRSALSHSLKVLEIPDVVITEDALAQCLGELRALEKLVVSDQKSSYYDIFHHLITDSLLRRLTWTPDLSCLVPRLNVLRCRTILDFDHDVFLDFVLSRLEPGRNAAGPLNVSLALWDECECKLRPAVAERLRELQAQKKMVFSLTEPEE